MRTVDKRRIQTYPIVQQLYPWILLFMSCLFLLFKYIVYVSPSVMTNELMRQFHFQATGLGELAACYFYSYLVMQLFAGPLLDKYSVRYLGAFALFCMSLGLILFSYAQTLPLAYASRMLMGIGAAFATVSYLKITAIWFSVSQYDIVAGLLATAASLGAISSQIPLAYGVEHAGWQNTLVYSGYLGFIIFLLYFIVVRSKPTNQKNNTPSSLSGFKDLITSKKVWFLTMHSGFAWSPLAVFGGLWGNPFLQSVYHVNKVQASELITIAFIGLAVGGPLGGYISSRYHCRFKVMFLGLLLSFLTLMGIIYFYQNGHFFLILELFLFGLGTGPFMLGFSFGNMWYPLSLIASFVAIVNTGGGLFTAFAEPFVGKILDLSWRGHIVSGVHVYGMHSYLLAMSALPIFTIMGMISLFVVFKMTQ